MIRSSADNALAESFNAALKREVLQDAKVFSSQLVCRRDVFRWCALKIQTDVLRDPKRFQRDATGEHWCTFAYLQRQTLFPRGHSGGVSRGLHDRDHQPETG